MRISLRIVLVIGAAACRSGRALPTADAIVEGRTETPVATDTIDERAAVLIDRGRFTLRRSAPDTHDFWGDIAALDLPSADAAARSIDQRTFALALKQLMASDPEGASVAFRALHRNTRDAAVRARARIGLTMALSWRSEWPALAARGAGENALAEKLAENARSSWTDPFLPFVRGTWLLDRGHAKEAVKLFERAVSLKPASAMFHAWLARALLEAKRESDAKVEFEAARRINPTHPMLEDLALRFKGS